MVGKAQTLPQLNHDFASLHIQVLLEGFLVGRHSVLLKPFSLFCVYYRSSVVFLGSFTKTSASFLPFTLSAPQIPVIHSVNFATFLGVPTGPSYWRRLDLVWGDRWRWPGGWTRRRGLMILLCLLMLYLSIQVMVVMLLLLLLLLLYGQKIVASSCGRDGRGRSSGRIGRHTWST